MQSNVGKLFRIRLAGDHNDDDRGDDRRARAGQAGPSIEEIGLGADNVKGGDGLLLDRGRLLVVQGAPTNAIAVVKLRRHRTRGTIESRVTNASFTTPNTFVGPSMIARARNLLLVVNANFAGAATAANFTVAGVPRRAVRHGGGHGRG